jgi:hypothetical protein
LINENDILPKQIRVRSILGTVASVESQKDENFKLDDTEKDNDRFLCGIRRSYSNSQKPDTFIEEIRELWQGMDNSFYYTIRFTHLEYRSTNKISYRVAMGVISLLNFIVNRRRYEVNQWSIFTGGLSLVSFISLFFTIPQKDSQLNADTAPENLLQIQMIYKFYSLQFSTLDDSNKRTIGCYM